MRAFLTILCIFLVNVAFAQLAPVKWSFEAEKINDKEYDIVITANIESGWAVYSQYLESNEGPVATTFRFFDIPLIGKTNEKGMKKEAYDDIFGMNLTKFSKKARFTQRVQVGADTTAVKGQLTFMTCNDDSCLPPEDIDFSIALGMAH